MKKLILITGVLVALSIQAKDYHTINFIACQNYVGVLKKIATVQEDGVITINDTGVTITSYGVTKSFAIVKVSNHTYTLDNGNQLIVSEAGKQIRYDTKTKSTDKYFSYSYIYNTK